MGSANKSAKKNKWSGDAWHQGGWYNDYYDAEATRPLSLVNTDNRLVAAAAKRRWEHVLGEYVHARQRGFLRLRSIL